MTLLQLTPYDIITVGHTSYPLIQSLAELTGFSWEHLAMVHQCMYVISEFKASHYNSTKLALQYLHNESHLQLSKKCLVWHLY